jgi:hypothetical protein
MLRNLDVFRMFPSIESADRCLAFLHRVLRGEFPCFNGTIKALRLPDAHPTALRFLRLVVPRLASLCSLLGGRVRAAEAGSGLPGDSGRDIAEETTGSLKFLGNPKCPFAHVLRLRQDYVHQTIWARQHGPRDGNGEGSHKDRSFEAQ